MGDQMEIEAEDFDNTVDWDTYMYGIDFTADTRWRNDPEGFFLGTPWQMLQRTTLYHVSQHITAASMDDPSRHRRPSPADIELMRRQELDGFRSFAPEKPYIMQHLMPDPKARGRGNNRLRTKIQGIDPPPTNRFQHDLGKGTYTYGIKLNALIASTWHSRKDAPVAADGSHRLPKDPHPTHQNAMSAPEVLEKTASTYEERISLMKDAVVEVLNGTEKVVATVREPDEDTHLYQMEQVFLELLGTGLSYNNALKNRAGEAYEQWSSSDDSDDELPDAFTEYFSDRSTPSPTLRNPPRPFTFSQPDVAERALEELPKIILNILTKGGVGLEQTYPIIEARLTQAGLVVPEPGKPRPKLADLRPKHIKLIDAAVLEILANEPATQNFTAQDIVELQKRIKHMIQARVLAVQQDPLAFYLPRSRRRYLTWSVSHDEHATQKNVLSTHYEHCPSDDAVRPIDLYHWVPIEVASPVFSGADENAEEVNVALRLVCDKLQHRFRTHHCALPTLDLTTSIFIGHSEGFTLLELKKFVTLYMMIERDLARLHRRHRSTLNGRWPCEPVRVRSRLGTLVEQPLDVPLVDPLKIMPHPSQGVREALTELMHDHFGVAGLINLMDNGDELFIRAIWLYTSVSDLARALETTGAPNRTSLAVRCAGRGERTSHLRKDSDLIFEANAREPSFPGEIDRHRGVLEFRFMGQSLDSEAILSWASICGKIVRAARETSPVAFRELIHLITHGGVSLTTLFDVPEHIVRPFMSKDEEGVDAFYIPRRDVTADYRFPFYKTGEEQLP
ncbi:hypothetical protein HD806DRAFT_378220 [Xylariaceae sp. AK1471]|nr:hypothetical protein HD806DRAFT_378220 [Xylariaceae sp. AK1471]